MQPISSPGGIQANLRSPEPRSPEPRFPGPRFRVIPAPSANTLGEIGQRSIPEHVENAGGRGLPDGDDGVGGNGPRIEGRIVEQSDISLAIPVHIAPQVMPPVPQQELGGQQRDVMRALITGVTSSAACSVAGAVAGALSAGTLGAMVGFSGGMALGVTLGIARWVWR